MSIIRAKQQKNFTIVDNGIFKTGGLAFDSRGLLCTLLSKPDDWNVIVKALEKETEGTRKHTKERGLHEMLKELIEAGYVIRKKRKSGEMDYYVYDTPQTAETANCSKSSLLKEQTAETANCSKSGVLQRTDNYHQELKKDNQELSCDDLESGVEDGDCGFASEPAPRSDFVGNGFANPSAGRAVQTQAEILPAEPVRPARPSENPVEPEDASATNRAVWAAYRQAYLDRYGVEPLRNAKVNGQIAQFVRTVGAEDAPKLAAFYPWHNGGFFVQRRHDFGLLLQSAQQIRTDWLRGEQMTAARARQAENTQSNLETVNRVLAARAARRQQGESA